jgi:sugar phosphate isomerase/epimerase
MKTGINSFGLSKPLNEDFDFTLKELRGYGIECFEPCVSFARQVGGLGKVIDRGIAKRGLSGIFPYLSAQEKMDKIHQAGFTTPSCHLMMTTFKPNDNLKALTQEIEFAKKNGILYYVFSFGSDDTAKAVKFIPCLKKTAEEMKKNGITLLFHNHWKEFNEKEGKTVLNIFLDNIPDLGMELDVGWACYAKQDPLALMEKYKGRIKLLHFKDIGKGVEKGQPGFFVPAGEGIVPLDDVVAKAQEIGMDFNLPLLQDQDGSDGDMLFDARLGAMNLSAGKNVSFAYRKSLNASSYPIPLSMLTFPAIIDTQRKKISFADVAKAAEANGLKQLDLMEIEIKLAKKDVVKAELAKHHLVLGALVTSINYSKINSKKALKKTKAALDLAAEFDCHTLMIVPAGIFTGRTNKPASEILPAYISNYTKAVTEGKKRGIKIVLEDYPNLKVHVSALADCLALLDAVPDLGLVYDTANMIPSGEDPLDFYEKAKGRIERIHLKDVAFTKKGDSCLDGKKMSCCLFGQGVVPLKEIVRRLIRDNLGKTGVIEFTKASKPTYEGYESHMSSFMATLFSYLPEGQDK